VCTLGGVTAQVSWLYLGDGTSHSPPLTLAFLGRIAAQARCVIATNRVEWFVCRSVLLYNDREPCKTAEPIEMPFGTWTRVGPGTMY